MMDFVYKTNTNQEILVSQIDLDGVDKMTLSMDPVIDETSEFIKIVDKSDKDCAVLSPAYENVKEALGLTYDEMLSSVPQTALRESIDSVTEQLKSSLDEFENREYLLTYLTIKRFLRSLSRPLVDETILLNVAESEKHSGVKQSILSLKPAADGFVERSLYSMSSSSTGRLTITRGPNILTMKSSARKALKSRHKKGKILQIDLSAAEPNIALNAAGFSSSEDVYQDIATNLLNDKVARSDAKLIVLCALYGQSSVKLQKSLPKEVNALTIIKKCREYFDVDRLEKRLEIDNQKRQLRNVVGRPISLKSTDRRLLVSYYLQSSAAELSVILFSDLMRSFHNKDFNITPLYVIHDALIVDCDECLSRKLLDKRIINLRMGDWSFYAKVSEVSKGD